MSLLKPVPASWRKRPLLIVAMLYAGGIILADQVSLPLVGVLPASLALAGAALLLPRARPWLLGLLLLLTGASNLTWRATPVSSQDLRRLVREDAAIVTLRGQLVDTPYHRQYDHDGEPTVRTLAQIAVQSIRSPGGLHGVAQGTVMVSTPGVLPGSFFGGRQVELEGVLRVPRAPVAPGQFDYRGYLRRHDIHFQLHVASTNDWRLVPEVAQPARPPLADRFVGWAQGVLARGLPEDDSMRLLWAMTLGWKTALTGEVSEPFMRSGTMHVFAISGLHIALIAGILVLVLRAARVPSHAAAWVVIPLIWFYTYATGWQASAIRSTIMMTVILAGGALRRPSDLLNSLSVAAFVILLWDPQQLFQAGFQLSFSVVLSLALCVPMLDGLRQPVFEPRPGLPPTRLQRLAFRLPLVRALVPDPLLPEPLRPRWQQWLRTPIRWLLQASITSLAAWLGSIPLVALYFNLFTPVSLLANLVVVPLSSAALAANMASLSVGAFVPGLAEVFNHAAWFFMTAMARISQWAASWPGACAYVSTPGWAFLALYYGTLLGVMTGCLKRPRWRGWAAGGLAGLATVWAFQAVSERHATRLTVLPLNGGDALCLDAPGTRQDLLIDCGDDNAAEFAVKPFLRSQGINHLSVLALTHGDIRHVGGAEFMQRQFRIQELALSPVSFRSAAYREVRAGSAHARTATRQFQRGGRLGPWAVLHPEDGDRFPQADDNALVLHGAIRGTRLLLLSDLGKPGQNALVERNPDLRAEIVVSGIPARGEPLAEALLDAIGPSVIIVTDSLFPATARAGPRLRERLASRSARVLYTSETGGLTLVLRDQGWRIETADGRTVDEGPRDCLPRSQARPSGQPPEDEAP